MQEEIFGPLLPVKTYRSLDEVIAYVNGKDRPLGFYVFTNDKATRGEARSTRTISGGVTINNCMLHVAQHDMPFGGIGASGMGHYHGYEGFLEFSKLRPVFTEPAAVAARTCSTRRTRTCTGGRWSSSSVTSDKCTSRDFVSAREGESLATLLLAGGVPRAAKPARHPRIGGGRFAQFRAS